MVCLMLETRVYCMNLLLIELLEIDSFPVFSQ
jgi:hypothetical protein